MKPVATNIRLPRKTLDALKMEAVKRRTSLAQLIRDAVEQTYGISSEESKIDFRKDPFFKLVGSIKGGRRDSSENHDDIYKE